MSAHANAIIPIIVEQHVEEAEFLWLQRDQAVRDPHYDLEDLSRHDDRLEAHIDGIRIAGDAGLELCEAALGAEDPGTVFTASVIAFESLDGKRIERVVGEGSKSRAAFRGLVSAMGWLDESGFKSIIGGLIRAKSQDYRRLAIAACGIRRVDPKPFLEPAINDPDLFLKARALKAAGELKRQDLLHLLQNELQNENHTCRFEAARSALLLGDRSALRTMIQFVQSASSFRMPAMQVALRVMDTQSSQNLLKAMAKDKTQVRDVLIGMGICGDPAYIPLLFRQMEIPEMARIAGESFSMITGVDLVDEDLESESPEGFEAGPTDDLEDEDVEMDEDEDLPWPEVELIGQWWTQNSGAFAAGERYLAGSLVSPEHCTQVLKNGFQRQRNAAALELALAQPESGYFNTKAPGFWQERRLG
jgi:uncharacterized protein (TIGR02270 family)